MRNVASQCKTPAPPLFTYTCIFSSIMIPEAPGPTFKTYKNPPDPWHEAWQRAWWQLCYREHVEEGPWSWWFHWLSEEVQSGHFFASFISTSLVNLFDVTFASRFSDFTASGYFKPADAHSNLMYSSHPNTCITWLFATLYIIYNIFIFFWSYYDTFDTFNTLLIPYDVNIVLRITTRSHFMRSKRYQA